MKNVLFLTNVPAPYTVDFFEGLGKRYCLTVLFERKQAENRKKEWLKYQNKYFKAIYLPGFSVGDELAFCPGVLKYLGNRSYDLIIVGDYSSPTGMLAISFLRLKGISYFIHADGGLVNNDGIVKGAVKRKLISKAAGYMSSGKKTDEYLVNYGANKEKCFHYPFTSIHEADIIKKVQTQEEKKLVRNKLYENVSEDKFIILSVGSIEYRKGFDILIKSVRYLSSNVEIYIIGGEATENLKKLMFELSVTNVHFLSFMPFEKIKKYMEYADAFVLPTRWDIWGLVVNEAMAAGLPVITTERCVAGVELIKPGENGYIVPAENPEILAEKINILVENQEILQNMSINSRETSSQYTIEKMVDVYAACIKGFFEHS